MQLATRVLRASESGYYAWRSRSPSLRSVPLAWPTEAITGIRTASRGTYGSPVVSTWNSAWGWAYTSATALSSC